MRSLRDQIIEDTSVPRASMPDRAIPVSVDAIENFLAAQAALRGAVEIDDTAAVRNLDTNVKLAFSNLLSATPDSEDERKRIIELLLEYSCQACFGEGMSLQVKQKIVSLLP